MIDSESPKKKKKKRDAKNNNNNNNNSKDKENNIPHVQQKIPRHDTSKYCWTHGAGNHISKD